MLHRPGIASAQHHIYARPLLQDKLLFAHMYLLDWQVVGPVLCRCTFYMLDQYKRMEQTLAALDDVLIENLRFKPSGNTARYITARNEVTFHASGNGVFNPVSGTKVIRISMGGDGFLDMSSLCLQMKVSNKAATNIPLVPLTPGAHCLFSRVRLLIGGAEVESIDSYSRLYSMLTC